MIYVKMLLEDAGCDVKMVMLTDASAAKAAAEKLSAAHMRHVRLAVSFIRLAVNAKIVRLEKVPGNENSADIHTVN